MFEFFCDSFEGYARMPTQKIIKYTPYTKIQEYSRADARVLSRKYLVTAIRNGSRVAMSPEN